jgi:uroporphyrinogen decarboxylase
MSADSYWKGPVQAEPDFENVLMVLRGEVPTRPTLMELFMNGPLHQKAVGPEKLAELEGHPRKATLQTIHGFRNLGYDYATLRACDLAFPRGERESKDTISLNEGALITGRESFEKYPWPSLADFPFDRMEDADDLLPDGMKVIIIGPGGVLENVVNLVGYESLCLMVFDDPDLVEQVFAEVGTRLVEYYRTAVQYDCVGAVWANDDWGFKTQTMLAPDDMRRYVIPWHARIAEVAHEAGRPSILHSCGCLDSVVEDIIETIKHDGRHSYEDAICPVEDMYEKLVGRIAVIGGMDMDFVCRATPENVYKRAKAMLERVADRGGYALGTGNSVPEYVPDENYFAMLSAAWEYR